MVLTLDAAARPVLFRPRLTDLMCTVLLVGALLTEPTFRGAAFGIAGDAESQSRRRVVVGAEVRWHDWRALARVTHPLRSRTPHALANLDIANVCPQ